MQNLGINTVNFPIEELSEYGLQRAEVCLGRGKSYEERLAKTLSEIEYAETHEIPYSIHLPVFVEAWYPYDYLSAFFLDPNPDLRALALRLLEHNLIKLKGSNAEFYVLHFGGVYDVYHQQETFQEWLKSALNQMDALAQEYDVKILLEYFGSNKNFAHYDVWIDAVNAYSHLGLLVDVGHLYFASIINTFDFMTALRTLSNAAEAFHLWTTKGREVYFKSPFYKRYHHIIFRADQTLADGWAFDSAAVIKVLKETGKPMILEASMIYEGESYFKEGIKECVRLAEA